MINAAQPPWFFFKKASPWPFSSWGIFALLVSCLKINVNLLFHTTCSINYKGKCWDLWLEPFYICKIRITCQNDMLDLKSLTCQDPFKGEQPWHSQNPIAGYDVRKKPQKAATELHSKLLKAKSVEFNSFTCRTVYTFLIRVIFNCTSWPHLCEM